MADDFVRERSGVLSNMLQMFMGNINLADKIQPEIIRFLSNEGTADLITTLLQKSGTKFLRWKLQLLKSSLKRNRFFQY